MSEMPLSFSDSDEDDSDYVPSENEDVEEEKDEEVEEEKEEVTNTGTVKNVCESLSDPTVEESKARVDSLWKQFLDDTGASDHKNENTEEKPNSKSCSPEQSQNLEPSDQASSIPSKNQVDSTSDSSLKTSPKEEIISPTLDPCSSEHKLKTSTNEIESSSSSSFNKEENESNKTPVTVSKKRPLGLDSLLGKIKDKKPKVTTLQKSLSDWESFKQEEGIAEDLEIFNRGKSGYLERQAFLLRSDHRSFEVERDIRLSKK